MSDKYKNKLKRTISKADWLNESSITKGITNQLVLDDINNTPLTKALREEKEESFWDYYSKFCKSLRESFYAREREIRQTMQDELETENKTSNFNSETREALWCYAVEHSADYSFTEIDFIYSEIADIIHLSHQKQA